MIIILAPPGVFLAHAAAVRQITFPVDGPNSFRNDFGEPRGGGTRTHLGIDIIANKMTPLVSAVDGRVSYIVIPEASWGYAISIVDDEGYSYRYLHVNNDTPGTDDGQGGTANAYAPGIARGARVTRGQHIGWVGDSGNAEATTAHLHFEIRGPDRNVINPYESLLGATGRPAGTLPGTVAPDLNGTSAYDPGAPYVFTQDLAEGMSGVPVQQLQLKLQALGYYSYAITAYFGPITRAAVVKFQTAKGIDPIGLVGPKTRSALNQDIILDNGGYLFNLDLSEGMSGEEVRQLQLKLQTLGYFSYAATGYFGPITRAAVVRFQIVKNIEPTGSVGLKTREALNQGAALPFPIASVGAPPAGAATGTVLVPVITAANVLPGGVVGADYSTRLYATDGFPPYAWEIIKGTLPAGLAFTSATAAISGIPAAAGVSDITVRVTDGNKATATKSFRIEIRPGFAITTQQLPSGSVGASYYIKLQASGGVPPYLWKVYGGKLPDGVTIDPYEGTIYGTPASPGFYGFYVGASDSGGSYVNKVFSINVQ